jgi:hypothetical protein
MQASRDEAQIIVASKGSADHKLNPSGVFHSTILFGQNQPSAFAHEHSRAPIIQPNAHQQTIVQISKKR